MSGVFPDSGVPPTDANNSLPNPDTVNCPDELWYSTSRCTPRFDPAAANAILSEIINLVNCGGTKYDCTKLDNLCTATKDLILDQIFSCLPDRFVNVNATCSNEFVILQRDASGCVRLARTDDVCKILDDHLFGCLGRQFPTTANACSIQYLTLTTDATGCRKIARYSAGGTQLAYVNETSVWPNGTQKGLPEFQDNPATYYDRNELSQAIASNTINYAKLNPNKLVQSTFNVVCAGTVELLFNSTMFFNPGLNSPRGGVSTFVARIDGKFGVNPANGIVNCFTAVTNFQNSTNSSMFVYLQPGSHTVEIYAIALQPHSTGQWPSQSSIRNIGDNIHGQGLSIRTAVT